MPLKIGSYIDGRYCVTARIGHGGMAEVYEANDVISKKRVAIKLILEEVQHDPVNLKRFENEAMIAARLNHPNIVRVYYSGVINGTPYIVNEYVKGQTLKTVLDFRCTVPLEEAISYMIQLCNALYYADTKRVVHRDIKPDNIFILPDGTVKLGDFGIAIAEGIAQATKNASEIIGSVHYMAPEIVKSYNPSHRSDIYAAGVTFFEMITGHVPYDDCKAINVAIKQVKEHFPSPKKYLPNCPKEVEKIIFKATKKNPRERYQSAREFREDLEALQKQPELLREKKSFLSKIFGFK